MHRTTALIVDPAATRAWLRQPGDRLPDLTRADCLGMDDELTVAGGQGFLASVDDVRAAHPDYFDAVAVSR